LDEWRRAAEEFLWTAEILMTMGRYPQAFMLACHAITLCKGGRKPFEGAPRECSELIFPKDGKTPEDLVDEETARRVVDEAKKCVMR